MARTGLADAKVPDADAMSAATKDVVDVHMISTKELHVHAVADDLWISISGDVYDVTPWLRHHPGSEITRHPALNHLLRVVSGNCLTGFAIAWWKFNHNTHHIAWWKFNHNTHHIAEYYFLGGINAENTLLRCFLYREF
ncbi:Delta(8)-fatty-acid desaturase 2 [Hordeum vulgare]|nr:Delta(8)-fatty-acid desaturase 2 [Hordeum vulgare]